MLRSLCLAVIATLTGGLAACGAEVRPHKTRTIAALARSDHRRASLSLSSTSIHPRAPVPADLSPGGMRFAVGLRVITIVDPRRIVRVPGRGFLRRRLVTVVRYPAVGHAGRIDLPRAIPARPPGRFPLVVFGHGFAVSPTIYARLLHAWAAAGYVVAAPVFPLESANAPGGPDESDLVNQPADISLVISRMLTLTADPRSVLAGVVDSRAIAVAGQSDGGEAALGAAYYPQFLDRRIDAVMLLSGARLDPSGFAFPVGSPPLLATQGSADVIHPPGQTAAFFNAAPPPKYFLTLVGASHLAPYTDQEPQLGIVERVTTAFLDLYLAHAAGASGRLRAAGDVPGTATLHYEPW